MELKLKPYPKNLFPKSAVLIQNASPKAWLYEIQELGLNLNVIQIYPVPSSTANVLYGCLVVFKKGTSLNDTIGKNRFCQNLNDKLFIPENTIIQPLLSENEWNTVFSDHIYIMHPDFGLVELEKTIEWQEILVVKEPLLTKLISPSKGITVPKNITSLRIEIDQEELLKSIENPVTEAEHLANLPFDMQKVLKGNQKEIDKYLKFLEEHPELALKYAIPLDIMGTSRGALDGKFKFGNGGGFFNWGGFFGSGGSGGGYSSNGGSRASSENRKIFFRGLLFLFLLIKAFSLSSSADGIFTVVKILFVFAILFGIIYLIFKVVNRDSSTSSDETSDYGNTSNVSYSANSGYQNGSARNYPTSASSSRPIYSDVANDKKLVKKNKDFFPYVIIGAIFIMSYLFVNYLSSKSIDTSMSPIIYIVGYFLVVFFVIFLIVKFFSFIGGITSDFEKNKSSGGVAMLDSDRFSTLREKYEKLAQDFVNKKEYEKAAHVHLKLLKNNLKAAQVLEEGKLYQEAATVYLKYCQNKVKAAQCYENGKAYTQAIELYKELNQTEKVGDLYLLINKREEANHHYYKVVDDYKLNSQYVKASLLLRNKINSPLEAQDLLLDGWRKSSDASKCLNNYFQNIPEIDTLKLEIETIYQNETTAANRELFLHLMKKEYEKDEELRDITKTIAYEIIAEKIDKKPEIATELLFFNKNDKMIIKDVTKFKLKRGRR